MGRLSFPFMRINIFIIALLLLGCNTTKRVEKQLNRAYKKHPKEVAKAYSNLFPIKSDSSEYVKWKQELFQIIDSISNLSDADSNLHSNGSNYKYSRVNKKEIERIKERIINIPFVIKSDSAAIYNLSSRLSQIEKDRDKYKSRWRTFFEISLCILILLLLVLLVKK